MTIRHVVCLSFVPEATVGQRDAVQRALRRLPAQIDLIRAYTVGFDLGIAEGNADFAVVADFDSPDDYRVYAQHPAHQAVITELVKPILAARTAVQFETGG